MNTDIHSILTAVLSLKTYEPSPLVDKTIADLVAMVLRTDSSVFTTIDQDVIDRVRAISSLTESALETHTAKQMLQSLHSLGYTDDFPYVDDYAELTKKEVSMITDSGVVLDKHSRILVIGSGPLPLTALSLFTQTGAHINQVDSSLDAVRLGQLISQAYGMHTDYIHGFGDSVELDTVYDVVLIAALAGKNVEEKQAILNNILPMLSEKGSILVRSTYGMRQLLYPRIEPTELKQVRLVGEFNPTGNVINSVLVYKK